MFLPWSDGYTRMWRWCGVVHNDFLFFADRVVLVRRESRVPLELLASRFASSHTAETIRAYLLMVFSDSFTIQNFFLLQKK